jgi:hypothetical protein
VCSPDVEHIRRTVLDHHPDTAGAQQPLHHTVGKTRPGCDPRVGPGNDRPDRPDRPGRPGRVQLNAPSAARRLDG